MRITRTQKDLKRLSVLLENHSFEESLKIIKNDYLGKFFTSFLKKIYPKFINEFKPLIEEINSDDISLVSAYIQGNLTKCPICGKYTLKTFCSRECAEKDPHKVEKIKKTKLERYGSENYNNIKKNKETCIRKYGVDNVLKVEEVKQKVRKTCLRKYGVDSCTKLESTKSKVKHTLLERYGSEKYVNVEQQLRTKIERYNTLDMYSLNKTKETMMSKYGASNYTLSPLKIFNTFKPDMTFEEFESIFKEHIKNANETFIRENFIKNSLFTFKDFLNYFFISESTGYLWKRKFNINLQNDCTNSSYSEIELYNSLQCDKRHNDRTLIYPLELDIVIDSIKLAIEYNGIYWHSTLFKDHKYHINKTLACKEMGYQLFHIYETDDISIWKSMINNKLHLNTKIYARKCRIKQLNYGDVNTFLKENHLQGECTSKINLGLFHEDKLVQVMTFNTPRFNKNYEYELIRLCSLKNYSVVGGASKLFNYFLKTFKPKSIISYANLRFSNGNIYKKLGFNCIGTSKPNYFYFKNGVLESRNKFQKHKLKGILETFDEQKTEEENMFDNGYLKIFDCGNLIFEYIL